MNRIIATEKLIVASQKIDELIPDLLDNPEKCFNLTSAKGLIADVMGLVAISGIKKSEGFEE